MHFSAPNIPLLIPKLPIPTSCCLRMRKAAVLGSHDHHHHHHLPFCLHCNPHDYIRMVQNMVERCLLLRMTKEDCIQALQKHAGIKPRITLTVWKELMKENEDFFHAYFQVLPPRSYTHCLEMATLRHGSFHRM